MKLEQRALEVQAIGDNIDAEPMVQAEGARDEVLPFTGAAHVGDLADLRVDELGERLFG